LLLQNAIVEQVSWKKERDDYGWLSQDVT
jgi:hypothetical protein